jgi:hypothetical protein
VLRKRLDDAGFGIEHTAHTTPALGYNFLIRHLGHQKRNHVHVPDFLAPAFAHTLFIRARKDRNARQ